MALQFLLIVLEAGWSEKVSCDYLIETLEADVNRLIQEMFAGREHYT